MAMLERREDSDEREQSGPEVRHRHAGLHRRSARIAGDRHDPRHALRDQIEPSLAAAAVQF
jgi:hypothetical protein